MSRWETVEIIDMSRRKPEEWAIIYNLKLIGEYPKDELWSEYEWAFNLLKMDYRFIPDTNNGNQEFDSYDKSSEMEMRAMELYRDLVSNADMGEKYVLITEKRFILTGWVRSKLMLSQ